MTSVTCEPLFCWSVATSRNWGSACNLSTKAAVSVFNSAELASSEPVLNPISEISGLKARLANLGFYHGAIDEELDDDTKEALCDFQDHERFDGDR